MSQLPPKIQHSNQREDLLKFLEISRYVETQRPVAEILVQRGQFHDAREHLKRLVQTIEDARAELASLPVSRGQDQTRDTVEYVLTQQIVLFTTELIDLDQHIACWLEPVPNSLPAWLSPAQQPPPVSSVPPPSLERDTFLPPFLDVQESPSAPSPVPVSNLVSTFPPPPWTSPETQIQPHSPAGGYIESFWPDPSKCELWQNTDPTCYEPALEPVTLQEQNGSLTGQLGSMSGAVRIGRQIDSQAETIEAHNFMNQRNQMSEDQPPEIPKNPRKRRGQDLPATQNKKPRTDKASIGKRPRSGQTQGGQEKAWGIRRLWRKINPFHPGDENDPQCSVNNGHSNHPPQTDQTRTDETLGQRPICISALQTSFHPMDHHVKATRDALAYLITLYDSTPHRLYPQNHSDDVHRKVARQRLQSLLDALNAITVDDFDVDDTRRAMAAHRAFIDTTSRRGSRNTAEEAEKKAALDQAAATEAELHHRLDWQRDYASRVFVGGEETASLFVKWIKDAREIFTEELKFGERAGQAPQSYYVGRGLGTEMTGVV